MSKFVRSGDAACSCGLAGKDGVRTAILLQPRTILLENVPALLKDFPELWAAMTDIIQSAGYIAEWRILDSQFHGVPQHRERLFLLAVRTDQPLCRDCICPGHAFEAVNFLAYHLSLTVPLNRMTKLSDVWPEDLPPVPVLAILKTNIVGQEICLRKGRSNTFKKKLAQAAAWRAAKCDWVS